MKGRLCACAGFMGHLRVCCPSIRLHVTEAHLEQGAGSIRLVAVASQQLRRRRVQLLQVCLPGSSRQFLHLHIIAAGKPGRCQGQSLSLANLTCMLQVGGR